ncbi:MAG TPA: RT0821/Lpp0805 family surface protein [Burkholderiales bacterium]|nr:RT0821/Lpp0805 family surface protein [Burkholderiales bacterium]
MNAKTFNPRVLTTIAALLPGTALAVNIFSTRDLPVRYMTDEDKDMLRTAVFRTLDRTPEGNTVRWENPKTGAHGDLTPRASFERAGQSCRDLEVANSARGHDNRVVLTLCKQPDGEWKVEPQ